MDSLNTIEPLKVGANEYKIFSLSAAEKTFGAGIHRLPVTLRVLMENPLRHEDGDSVTIAAASTRAAKSAPTRAAGYYVFEQIRGRSATAREATAVA